MSAASPATAAAHFARIVAGVVAAVAGRLQRPGCPGLAGPLIVLIAARLQRMAARVTRLAARVEASTLRPPRPRPPSSRLRPAKPPRLPTLPRGRAWLARLVPGAAFGATRLEALLAEAEMQALLAAAPQLGRTLRPYWHMLTTRPLPPALRPPPKNPPPTPPAAQMKPVRRPPAAPPAAASRHRPRPTSPPAPEVAGAGLILPVPA